MTASQPAQTFQALVLSPIGAIAGAVVGTVLLFISHLCMAAMASPGIWCTLCHAACASKKVGISVKPLAILVLTVLVPVVIPIFALYGALAGFCWGTISGFQICGAVCSAGQTCGNAQEALHHLNRGFYNATVEAQTSCDTALRDAQTKELGPGEHPVEVNPLRACIALLAALLGGCVGAVVFFLTGARFYCNIACKTSKDLSADKPCPLALVIHCLTPFWCLLVCLLYPFVGFVVCFFAVGLTCYLEVALDMVCRTLFPPPPPRPKAPKRSWWQALTRSSPPLPPPQPPSNAEPLLPATTGQGGCHSVLHFIGVTGIPFGTAALERSVERWWQGHAYLAAEGVVPLLRQAEMRCTECLSCSCCECCCCGCCCAPSNARELKQAEEGRPGYCAPDQLHMGVESGAVNPEERDGCGLVEAAAPQQEQLKVDPEHGDAEEPVIDHA